MAKYRLKPIVVEADQVTEDMVSNSPRSEKICTEDGVTMIISYTREGVWIDTLKESAFVNVGDWIITGLNGEKFKCKQEFVEKLLEKQIES